jgi:hypothetical protein
MGLKTKKRSSCQKIHPFQIKECDTRIRHAGELKRRMLKNDRLQKGRVRQRYGENTRIRMQLTQRWRRIVRRCNTDLDRGKTRDEGRLGSGRARRILRQMPGQGNSRRQNDGR